MQAVPKDDPSFARNAHPEETTAIATKLLRIAPALVELHVYRARRPGTPAIPAASEEPR